MTARKTKAARVAAPVIALVPNPTPEAVAMSDADIVQSNAFNSIATLALLDSKSRGDLVEALRLALGDNPTDDLKHDVRTETVIGRVTARLPKTEFPVGCLSVGDRMDFVRAQLTSYAAHDAAKLKVGMLGRRTETMDKAIKATREYWSQLMAELGQGNAKTQDEKNAAKRATNANPVRGEDKAKDAKPDAKPESAKPESAKPESATQEPEAKLVTQESVCGHVLSKSAELLAYANSATYAKHLPTDFGAAVIRFHRDIAKAECARLERAKLAGAQK